MENNKTNKKRDASKEPALRGKQAIAAGKKAAGKNPADPATQKEEKKDAAKWRNEG